MLFAVDNTTLFLKNNINNSFAGKTYAERSFEPSGEIRTHPSGTGLFFLALVALCERSVVGYIYNNNFNNFIQQLFRWENNSSQRDGVFLLFSFISLRSWRSYLPLVVEIIFQTKIRCATLATKIIKNVKKYLYKIYCFGV